MKISFNDKSYVECKKSDNPGKIILTISAKSQDNHLKKIINSVEIEINDLKQLVSDIIKV